MTDFDPHKAPSRPNSPLPVAWFEFLIDTNLLEKHLAKENPDPSAIQLIIQFLANALRPTKKVKEQNGRDDATPDVDTNSDQDLEIDKRRFQALLQLTLKIASYLKWNLHTLAKGIPLPMLHVLLTNFVELTFKDFPLPLEKKPHEMNFCGVPHQSLFALHLYHRWCLQTVINESFPKKPPSTISVSLPGQSDPTNVPPAAIETIMKSIKDLVLDSVDCLEEFIKQALSLKMPTMECISCLKLNVDVVEHDWEQGLDISPEELECQICFDLGSFYFYGENYPKALERISRVCHLITQIKNPVYLVIDKDQLQGYLNALNFTKEILNQKLSLVEKIEVSRKNDFKDIVTLLIQDNIKEELSWSYRNCIEYEIQSGKYGPRSDVYFQVCTCNMVKSLMKGNAVPSSYMELLKTQDKKNIEFLIKVVSDSLVKSSPMQKKNVKFFLGYLCHNQLSLEMSKLINISDLSQLLEMHDLMIEKESEKQQFYKPVCDPMCYTDNISLRIGDLERKLCLSYNCQEIRTLIAQLSTLVPKKPLWTVNYKWEIPREIQHHIKSLPFELHDIVFILMAKAKECIQLKSFGEAKEILLATEGACKDAFYLVKLIKWELLFCDLLEIQWLKEYKGNIAPNPDCTRKVKTCLTALTVDSDVSPRHEIVEQCAAYLLNVQDWDYLITSDHNHNGHLIFSRYLSSVCKMVQANKSTRSIAEEFWEAVLQIFYLNAQQKRSASGQMNPMYRENSSACITRSNFILFLLKIKEELSLGILLSCLSKIYNILRDDISSDIYYEYSNLWPTVVRDSGAYSLPGIYDNLKDLLKHMLSVNSVHPGWLRSQGDFFYGQNQYAPALKYYLEAGVVGSDFFSVQVPKTIFDDQVYRRMIKCCSQLQCYTQVGVLCQCLDEIDYSTAFKALQEKGSNDGMDSYYNCIWDVALLEFLIYTHSKRGEIDKKQLALKAIGQLELNARNHEEILIQAMQVRKSRFFRSMAKQYL